MNRTQLRRQQFFKEKGGQAYLTKEQIVRLMWKPKKIQMTGAEFINTRDLTGK